MKLRPSQTAFGCCSLLLGVQVICAVILIDSILVVSICSSTTPVRVMGVTVTPLWQVVAASWGWIGIPIVIMAGVGAVYRIAENIMIFCYYLLGSLCIGAAACVWLLTSGSACGAVVAPEIQRMGSSFVCSFTDAFIFSWTLILGLAHVYLTYIVWSAAEELAELPRLRLIQYGASLEQAQHPKRPDGLYALPPQRTEPLPAAKQLPPTNPASAAPTATPGSTMPPTSGLANDSQLYSQLTGQPQSFIPSPPSGMDFAMSRNN